jgi:hypothetical protein
MTLMIGANLALVLLGTVILLLRTLHSTRLTDGASFEDADLDYRPMRRLLDPAEFRHLRDRGISKDVVNKLRSQRRDLYRSYVRSMAQEFKRVHNALKSLLVCSYSDRPDLATFLTKQTILFHRNMILVELRLTLHAFGVDAMPEIDLFPSLEMLQAQFRQLVPVTATVSVD